MATLIEQLKAKQDTIDAMVRAQDERDEQIAHLLAEISAAENYKAALAAAREDAQQTRALMARCIEEHSIALAAKNAVIEQWKRVAKDRGMQLLKLMNRSAVDKAANGQVTGQVVSHREAAMQEARDEAIRTGKAVAVKL